MRVRVLSDQFVNIDPLVRVLYFGFMLVRVAQCFVNHR